jgi:hypothetical protein
MNPIFINSDNYASRYTYITLKSDPAHVHTSVVWAQAQDKDSNGLRGDGSGKGAGVFGNCVDSGPGVYGISTGGPGIRGESTPQYGTGVEGVGVVAGLAGSSDTGFGLWGTSNTGSAIVGHAKGQSGSKAIAIDGRADYPTQWAGSFQGNVSINGNLHVTGAKSAAIPFPDGSLRRFYSVESPETWFEDFGEGNLIAGRAEITIDPHFAAVVRGDYHVFLTPYGDSNGLYVAQRHGQGFVVNEQRNGASTLAFGYRVVARRKDIENPRFGEVAPPPLPDLPSNFPKPRDR